MFLWCWVVAQWQKNGQIFRNVHALLQPMWLRTLPLQKFTKSDNFRTVIFVPQQNINQHGSFFKNLGSGLPCVPPTAILAALLTCSPCLAFKFHVLAADSPLKVDAVGWIAWERHRSTDWSETRRCVLPSGIRQLPQWCERLAPGWNVATRAIVTPGVSSLFRLATACLTPIQRNRIFVWSRQAPNFGRPSERADGWSKSALVSRLILAHRHA